MSYERLKSAEVVVFPILNDQIRELLKRIKRQLTTRQKNRNNRKVVTFINIQLIFLKFYRALRDHCSEHGRTITLNKKPNREIKNIVITFTHKGTLLFHLAQVVSNQQQPVKHYFSRKIGSCQAEIIVTEEEPAEMKFDMKQNKLYFSSSYKVKNKYGNIC